MRNAPIDWLRIGWRLTMGTLIVGYVAFLQYLHAGLPGVRYAGNTALLPVGWPELGRSLESRKEQLRNGGADRVLIVGMDKGFLASEVAFYQADQSRAVQETTGVHLFGGNSLMYAYWFPPREQDGATLLLVSFKRDELKAGAVRQCCQSLSPIEERLLQVKGRPVRPYYTRVGYNYRSDGYHRTK